MSETTECARCADALIPVTDGPYKGLWMCTACATPASEGELLRSRTRQLRAARREVETVTRERDRLKDEADYGDGGVGYLDAVNHGTDQAVRALVNVLDDERPRTGRFGGESLEALAQRLEKMRADLATSRAALEDVRRVEAWLAEQPAPIRIVMHDGGDYIAARFDTQRETFRHIVRAPSVPAIGRALAQEAGDAVR